MYIAVVTLSTEDDNNFLELLKLGFKRTIKWNKHRSEMTNQTNNLHYLTDPKFKKVNKFCLIIWKWRRQNIFFKVLYTKSVNRRLQCLIDGKSFFDVPLKNKEEAYENIIEITKNNDYATVIYWTMRILQSLIN